jgi:hypothetical protein
MTVRFCTLFDQRYATRGIVMLESLERFRKPGEEVLVLTLDELSRNLVERIGAGRWRAISVEDLSDQELRDLEKARPHREFCWTCTPALSDWLVRNSAEGDVVVYLDADIMFFDDPHILLGELIGVGSVLIHEHRYSPDRHVFETSSGRFNVGFVAFSVGPEARACSARWRQQTIECCELDPARGLCGDQGYLNTWPSEFSNMRVMRNIGGGVAPWNVNQYVITAAPAAVDGTPVVFFHYHAFKFVVTSTMGAALVEPAYGYTFSREVIDVFYRPYAKRLIKAVRKSISVGMPFEPDNKLSWRDVVAGVRSNRFLPAF